MQKKRIVLSICSTTLLLAVIAVCLVNTLGKSSIANASGLAQKKVSALANRPIHYPDPTNQDALPESVKVTGAGEQVLLRAVVIEGSQIYECKASTTAPGGFAWQFQAPFAYLKSDDGTNVIHSTGPTWLYTQDGSGITAKVGQFTNSNGSIVPANATPDASSIPWLRLDVTAHLGNTGLFSRVDQVQRLYTREGIAPSSSCNQNVATKHVIQPVNYTAEYIFWGR